MISNFKLFPYFNILQNFVENVRRKQQQTFVLGYLASQFTEVGADGDPGAHAQKHVMVEQGQGRGHVTTRNRGMKETTAQVQTLISCHVTIQSVLVIEFLLSASLVLVFFQKSSALTVLSVFNRELH